jgi:predicted RNA-binding Zn-ribbon protein involved in translation (DUF1610 family)
VAEKALDGDVKAQALMKRYSLQDTRLNVMVYDRVRPWITNHPNLGLYHSDADKHCPMCGSVDMADAGYVRTALTTYQAWRCNGCGGVSRANFVKGRVELRGAT